MEIYLYLGETIHLLKGVIVSPTDKLTDPWNPHPSQDQLPSSQTCIKSPGQLPLGPGLDDVQI